MHYKDIIRKLISINTEHNNSTLNAVSWIKSYLSLYGIESRIYTKNFNNIVDPNRGTLIATIGNPNKPGIIFSGHLDTVPVNKINEWATDPFVMKENDGNLYGLGSVDMKGAIASILALVPQLKKSNKTFHFVFTHDEEGGFTAIRQLLSNNFFGCFQAEKQIGAVIMEPTNLSPIFAHTGNKRVKISVNGITHHASHCDLGVDALRKAADIYTFLWQTFDRQIKIKNPYFDPPTTQLNIGSLSGGHSDYFVPGSAELSFSLRYLPHNNIDSFFREVDEYINKKILPELKKTHPNTNVIMSEKSHVIPFYTDPNDLFVQSITNVVKKDLPEVTPTTASWATEAGYFQKAGVKSVVVWGPGDIMLAHKPNEFVPVQQLEQFGRFIVYTFVNSNTLELKLMKEHLNRNKLR